MEFERKDLVHPAAAQFIGEFEGFVCSWLEQGKELPLSAYLGTVKGDTAHITPIPAKGTKDLFAAMVRTAAEALKSDFVLLVCEAWKASATKEERDQYGGEVRNMPGASDVVYFQLESEKGTWLGYSRVAEFEEGKPRTMEPVFMKFGGTGDGRFVGLLPQKQTTKH